jgi:beta-ribofuranosylaminobenzene 5'-phosphate synthase
MIRVQTGSRLHFGLLSLSREPPWANSFGDPTLQPRQFGGVGLMVQQPCLRLVSEPATQWSADGPLAERALGFARSIAERLAEFNFHPRHLHIEEAPPEHRGLGTGTQLGLAVARALVGESKSAADLAELTGRGHRSALGIHGFEHGGFLVEAGKLTSAEISPLVARVDFPDEWRIVLVLPPWGTGLHGAMERDAFRWLIETGDDPSTSDALCRLVLLGMLPALQARDWHGFGEAVYDYNVRAGALFAPVQPGIYTHAETAEVVAFARRFGVPGVGQSSWGPAVFAIARDAEEAEGLAAAVRTRFRLAAEEVVVTYARNAGAAVHSAPEEHQS